jgi:isoquinoline 1-oxidoreductase subunit beta
MTELSTHRKIAISNVSRRDLLKGVVASGGLVLAAQLSGVKGAFAGYPTGASAMPNGVVSDPKIFVSIGGDGIVSIVAARAEMGTGAARTALPMMVADEMGADWARVKVVQSPGDEKTYGNQDTDGSRSVRHFIQPMRQCGAAARQMLEAAAAKKWGVDVGEVETQVHEVVHKASGRKLGFGELAADAAAQPVPAEDKIKLKDASAFRYIGKGNVRPTDQVDITTGHAVYGQDIMLPGMKFAVLARPPVVGGKVASLDSSAAMKVPGVEKIITLAPTPAPYKFAPLGGVAVIANSTWAALKGREALKITWDAGPNKAYDSKAYRAQLEESVRKPGKVERNVGDVDKALASAAKVITAEYYAPHMHHATMEPPAAAASMSNGKWEVWAPVQSPGGARDDVAKALGIKP